MNKKILAALGVLLAAPWILAPTGGFPSFIRFSAVGIGAAPGSTLGNLTASGAVQGNRLGLNQAPSATAGKISQTVASSGAYWGGTDGTTTAQCDFSGGWECGTVGSAALALYTNSAARMSISSTGDVTVLQPPSGVALTVNGVNTTQFAETISGPTGITAPQSINDAGFATGMYFGINPGVPAATWINASATTDTKSWDQYADSSGVMHFRLVNDADTSALDWMNVTRTGIASAVVNIAPGAQVGGSGICTANGTNCPAGTTIKQASGLIHMTTTPTCTVSTNVIGIASCNHQSAGNWQVVFSTGFTSGSTFQCQATKEDISANISVAASPIGATTAQILQGASGTATDENMFVNFACTGT